MSTTRNACTRRSDTNRLLSSRLRSRKTKHDNSSWQPHCHRNYRVSLEGCSPTLSQKLPCLTCGVQSMTVTVVQIGRTRLRLTLTANCASKSLALQPLGQHIDEQARLGRRHAAWRNHRMDRNPRRFEIFQHDLQRTAID